MSFQTLVTNRFVKSEDLNHHGTLFAGRSAEWFIEAGLMAVSGILPADNIVCVKLNEMSFTTPVNLGDIARFEATPVYAGKSSIITYNAVYVGEKKLIEGFITYVNIDANGKAQPHGITLTAETEEEKLLQERAAKLKSRA
ncbi:MAG: acyl-CoA thioesterase [Lachnospiraceae bacterium]|nr:acyl-CoA thioesterase [Lachnospiraceae bacterium]